jgi:hypothetical protein
LKRDFWRRTVGYYFLFPSLWRDQFKRIGRESFQSWIRTFGIKIIQHNLLIVILVERTQTAHRHRHLLQGMIGAVGRFVVNNRSFRINALYNFSANSARTPVIISLKHLVNKSVGFLTSIILLADVLPFSSCEYNFGSFRTVMFVPIVLQQPGDFYIGLQGLSSIVIIQWRHYSVRSILVCAVFSHEVTQFPVTV